MLCCQIFFYLLVLKFAFNSEVWRWVSRPLVSGPRWARPLWRVSSPAGSTPSSTWSTPWTKSRRSMSTLSTPRAPRGSWSSRWRMPRCPPPPPPPPPYNPIISGGDGRGLNQLCDCFCIRSLVAVLVVISK
jgi:hypothetical protein